MRAVTDEEVAELIRRVEYAASAFRICRKGSDWRLLHRHANPLVHVIKPELFAEIARGDDPAE